MKNIFSILINADIISQLIFLLLIFLLIFSVYIILHRWILIRFVFADTSNFQLAISKSKTDIIDIQNISRRYDQCPISYIFGSAITTMREYNGDPSGLLYCVESKMQHVASSYITRLESKLSALAIIGSVAPFIGLTGTVWGVMHSFSALSSNVESMSGVFLGMSEALFATLIGLIVSIPCIVTYKIFMQRVYNYSDEVDGLIQEFCIKYVTT